MVEARFEYMQFTLRKLFFRIFYLKSKGFSKSFPVESYCQAIECLAGGELTGKIKQKKGCSGGIGAVRFHSFGLQGLRVKRQVLPAYQHINNYFY